MNIEHRLSDCIRTCSLDNGRLGPRLEGVRQAALAAVLTVLVECHEDPSAALRCGALTTETFDLPIGINLVVFQDGHLDLFALVLDLLGGVVSLLLSLFGTTTETENQVECRLLLYVIVAESAAVLELLAGKDQALLVRRDAFLVLYLSFDVIDCVRGLDFESDSFAREGLDENLHSESDALVCPTNSTMESLTKARAGVEEKNWQIGRAHV